MTPPVGLTATAPGHAPRDVPGQPPAARPALGALGAVGDQVLLAAGSLLLQVVALRAVGAEGLGTFALLFGGIIIATAVSTGLVGDSLTVLDRQDPAIRSALLFQAALTVGLATAVCAAAPLVGALTVPQALAWAVATVSFMTADLVRRILIAGRRFWTLVVTDFAGVATTGLVLLGSWLLAPLAVVHLLVALAAGQGVAAVLAWRSLPAHERSRVPCRPGAWRSVVAFGGWRALQQFVRPTTLNAARWLVLAAAGAAAVGQVEAARVFVAPAMVLVQGVGAYLFATYAADRGHPAAVLRRRADRAAALMLGGAIAIGAVAVWAAPLVDGLLTGGAFPLSVVAVTGWTVYAASCAAVLPYGSLAAVRGDQAKVLGLRALDSAVSLALVAVALLALGWSPASAPWLLSAGSFVGGLLCRRLLLTDRSPRPGRPHRPRSTGPRSTATATARRPAAVRAPVVGVSPLRRTPLRLFVVCLVLLVAAVPWRRGTYYDGGLDAVVLGKAALTGLALLLVLTAPSRGVPWTRLRAGPVPWLLAYLTLATTGAALAGEVLPSLVLAVRLGLLTFTLVLLFRRYGAELVLSALGGSMLALALFSAATGVGSLASEGRLYGRIPPINANEIALMVSVPVLCLAWRALQQLARPVEVVAILPLLGVVWLTGTRTGLGALVVAVLLLVSMTPRLPRSVAAAGLVAVPSILYVMFWTSLLTGYATRGDATDLMTLNSRTVAWTAALDYPDTLLERLLGVGIAVKVIPVSAMYRDEQILDSTWVSALVQVGVLGSVLLVLLVLTMLTRALATPPPQRSLLVAALALLTVRSALESGLFDTSVSFIVFFCFAMAAHEVTDRSP